MLAHKTGLTLKSRDISPYNGSWGEHRMNIKRNINVILFIICSLAHFQLSANVCTDADRLDPTICLNGVGAATYGVDNVRLAAGNFSAATNRAANDDDSVADGRFGHSNLNGLSAGDHFAGWGFWGSFNNTDYDGSLPINAPIGRVEYEGDIKSVLFGADKLVTDRLVLGLAIGYEESEAFTLYNGGNNDADGYTIAPYAAFFVNNFISIDAAVGYTELEYETDRVSLATAGTTNFGSYDSDRWFAAINLNASGQFNDFLLTGRVGYLYTEEDQDGYTETGGADARQVSDRKFDLSQLLVGVEVAYNWQSTLPYIGLAWAHDLDRENGGNGLQPGLPGGVAPTFSDDNEIQLTFGLRHYGDYISAMLDFNTVLERDSFDSHGVMFTLRADL